MKRKTNRYTKVLHPLMPRKLYEHLLRTAIRWGIDGDLECCAWFLHELEVRNYQCAKAEFESLRRNSDVLKGFKGQPCCVCGKPSDTVDHVIPISRGGNNELSNLRPLCRSCNSTKADTVIQ